MKNPISSLSKWKIFDNLRRSLVPIALMSIALIWLGLFTFTRFLDTCRLNSCTAQFNDQFFVGDLAKTGGRAHTTTCCG